MIKFDGTLSDWAAMIIFCLTIIFLSILKYRKRTYLSPTDREELARTIEFYESIVIGVCDKTQVPAEVIADYLKYLDQLKEKINQ